MKYIFGPTSWDPRDADPEYMATHFSFNGHNYFICKDQTVYPYDWTPELRELYPLPDDIKEAALMWWKTWRNIQPAHEFLEAVFNGPE